MRGTVAPGVSLPGDLVLVVDRIRDAPTAAEGADRSHSAVLVDKPEKIARGVVRITCDDTEIIDAVCIARVTAERSEVNHLAVAKETRVVLPAEMRRIADDLAGVIQGVGDTVIRAKRADVDHLAARVEEGAIRTSRKSGVTGDLPGGVDPARLAILAAECTDIDQLTIGVKKPRVAHLTRRRTGFSRHLAAAIDAKGDAVISITVWAERAEIGNRVGLGECWRREQGECGELHELPNITFAIDKEAGFHWCSFLRCARRALVPWRRMLKGSAKVLATSRTVPFVQRVFVRRTSTGNQRLVTVMLLFVIAVPCSCFQ